MDAGNALSREDFANGYAIYAFDLSPDSCNGNHFNLVKSGNLRLQFIFDSALQAAINCVVYMEYENMIEINKNRNNV